MGMSGTPYPGDITGMPPPSMDIQAQQAPLPDMAQFAGQGQGGPNASIQFATSKMNEIAAGLGQVARVIQLVKPELMPLIEKIAMAGSMIVNELTANQNQMAQGQDQSMAQPQATGPEQMGLGA